jgi:hypothetical protein
VFVKYLTPVVLHSFLCYDKFRVIYIMKKSAAILLSIILIISAAVPSTAATEPNGAASTVDVSSAAASEGGTSAVTSEDDTSAAPDSDETGTAKSDNNASGGTKYIEDDMTGIRTEISSETLDDHAYTFLRGYFNDNTLTEDQLFNRFFDLKKSYIRSLESLYNVNYLSNSSRKSETALHIYYEGSDTLFGIEGCGVYLYNISVYEGLKHREESHLDLIIPVRGTNTIEMIRFTIPKENLGILAYSYVANVLSENRVKGAAPQYRAPAILYSESLTEDAKHGIYPAESQADPTYVSFEDTAAGYGIHIPYSYIPFVQNNLGGDYSYNSYKINPNLIFSISSEPIDLIINFALSMQLGLTAMLSAPPFTRLLMTLVLSPIRSITFSLFIPFIQHGICVWSSSLKAPRYADLRISISMELISPEYSACASSLSLENAPVSIRGG